jgi:hypothetical protein
MTLNTTLINQAFNINLKVSRMNYDKDTSSELKVVSMNESNIKNEFYKYFQTRGSIGHLGFLVKWTDEGERANTWKKASKLQTQLP